MRLILLLGMVVVSGCASPHRAAQDGPADAARPMALEPLPANAETSRRLAGRLPLEAGRFTLAEFAAHLEREVGVSVRFDWDGLAEAGITPQTTVDIEAGEAEAQRALLLVLMEAQPEPHRDYPTYFIIDGQVVIGTPRSLVRLAPQVSWPQREAASRPVQPATHAELELQRIVTVNFGQVGLGPATDYVRDVTGNNLVVNWTALEAVGVDYDTEVSFMLTRVTAEHLLGAILDEIGSVGPDDDRVGYTIYEGTVYISTQTDISKHKTTVEVYDIRDILDSYLGSDLMAVYRHDELAMELLAVRLRQQFGEDEDRWQHRSALQLVFEMIQENVGHRDAWLDEDFTLEELNGQLTVKTTWLNHREVSALLDALREGHHQMRVDFVRELEVVRLLRRAEATRAQGDPPTALGLVKEALAVDPLHEPARALRAVLEEMIDRGGE